MTDVGAANSCSEVVIDVVEESINSLDVEMATTAAMQEASLARKDSSFGGDAVEGDTNSTTQDSTAVSLVTTTTTTTAEENATSLSPTSSSPPPSSRRFCCGALWHYEDLREARGYALLAMGRGVAVMGNVVVSVALVQLATEAAGCESGTKDECTGKIYGLNPASLISGIPVVSGLLGAFLMPIIGVILDFTSYRRLVGIITSVVFTLIQAIQICIGVRTWFAMAILQALAGFCFTIVILTTIAYLPEICEQVGQLRHAQYTSRFTGKQFAMQASFLVLVSGLSFALGIADDSILTARFCQALNFVIITLLFSVGWYRMPSRQATRKLPEGMHGCRMILYGIRQNIRTALSIHRDYRKGLRWYLIATMFAQAGVAALTSTSVVYLSTEVGLNATDTLLFFLVVLVGTIPGAKLALVLSKFVNPSTSWQLSQLTLFTVMVIGAFTLGDAPNKYFSLIWGFVMGIVLGWFYPTENLFFSCILPKGQEAEISGFRVYLSTILAWFPPLCFSILVENGYDPKWGLSFMGLFILVAAALLRFGTGTWDEILEESGRIALSVASVRGSSVDLSSINENSE